MIKNIAISSFIASCFMFSLFYVWHGLVLNDFLNLKLPIAFFLILVSIVYFISGLILSIVVRFFQFKSENILLKGFLLGGIYGFFLYSVAILYGMSFSNSLKLNHLAVDYLWQIFEQGTGGMVITFLYQIFLRIEKASIDN